MKTKQEVAAIIRHRITELEENIKEAKQIGDWELVRMHEQTLALRKSELRIFEQ